ncbi:MAG: hypothetical protein KGJ02_06355 [Verrucomicrobiota bacterium]|nr:hypothetical protein [Verrucomicrobiota bacterium]
MSSTEAYSGLSEKPIPKSRTCGFWIAFPTSDDLAIFIKDYSSQFFSETDYEPRPKGRGMIWEEFRTPPKFGCELPGLLRLKKREPPRFFKIPQRTGFSET